MAYDAKTQRLISLKKLAGKAHTSNDKDLANEALSSGITMSSATVFGQEITETPSSTALYTITGQVEYIRFPVSFIAGSDTSSGRHGFELKLPADYEANSSNPRKGTAPFLDGQVINTTAGGLQLVPTSFAAAYEAKPFYGGTGAKGSGTQIPILDARDWYLDYFNGILFQQDPPGTGAHAENPDYVEGYLYIGNMLDVIAGSGGGGSGDANAQYLVLSLTGSLTSERRLNPGTGISGNDAGAGDNYTISVDNSVVATLTGSQFSGNVGITGSLGVEGQAAFRGGLSGSLQQLSNGTPYLRSGAGISITTGSSGEVTITSTSVAEPAGSNTEIQFNDGGSFGASSGFTFNNAEVTLTGSLPKYTLKRKSNTEDSSINFKGSAGFLGASISHAEDTNDLRFDVFNGTAVEEILRLGDHFGTSVRQVVVLSGSNMAPPAMQPRDTADIAFFVSGAIGSRGTSTRGTSVFGGDTVVSGTVHALNGLTGSLQQLSNGTPYLRSGAGISITTGSAGEVTVARTGAGTMSRSKDVYFVTNSVDAGNAYNVYEPDFAGVSYDFEKIDIFLNGQLLHSGSSAQISGGERDYYIDTATSLKFAFDVFVNDILDVVIFSVSS